MKACGICEEMFISHGNYPDSDIYCAECSCGGDNLILATPEFREYYEGRY